MCVFFNRSKHWKEILKFRIWINCATESIRTVCLLHYQHKVYRNLFSTFCIQFMKVNLGQPTATALPSLNMVSTWARYFSTLCWAKRCPEKKHALENVVCICVFFSARPILRVWIRHRVNFHPRVRHDETNSKIMGQRAPELEFFFFEDTCVWGCNSEFLRLLGKVRSRSGPHILRSVPAHASIARWSPLLTHAAQTPFAASLVLQDPTTYTNTDGNTPPLSTVLEHHPGTPPPASRLPLRPQALDLLPPRQHPSGPALGQRKLWVWHRTKIPTSSRSQKGVQEKKHICSVSPTHKWLEEAQRGRFGC